MALIGYSEEYLPLEDKTFVVANRDSLKLYDINHSPLEPKFSIINMSNDDVEKGEFPHFMLKEIHEQPSVVRRIVSNYFDLDKSLISADILKDIKASDRIYILAAGHIYACGFNW